jgi:hypothetical protein
MTTSATSLLSDDVSRNPAEDERNSDAEVLSLLLGDDAQRPWAVEELEREVGDKIAVNDSLARLYGAGLVHRLEGFVFASRAAVRGAELQR